MNRSYLIFQVVLTLIVLNCLWACDREKDVSRQEDVALTSRSGETLSLKAPNGEWIASSIADLKEEAAWIVGEGKEFRILALNYLEDIKEGYVVFVEYEMKEGVRGNYVKCTSPELKFTANELITRISSSPGSESENVFFFQSRASEKCSGEECVLEGKGTSIWCKCADCALEMRQR